jgi:uncharacterized protein YutE (UPF0331/DUF86 family)
VTRGRPDVEVVRRHLSALREALAHLDAHRARSAAELRADTNLRWLVERGLQLCAQNALDVATHLSVAAGLDAPDYATAVDRLAEAKVVPAEFAARFRAVAGFRNVLVHGYLVVDLQVVEEVLRERLPDFEEFAARIERYLEGSAGS